MWRIARRLYLGDQFDSQNVFALREARITHILNCAGELRCPFRQSFRYLHLKLTDPDEAFIDHIPEICQFIHHGRKRGGVMVHCRMGISRSVSAILAYLRFRGKTTDEALRMVARGVGEKEDSFFLPHFVFLDQIEDYFEAEEEAELEVEE